MPVLWTNYQDVAAYARSRAAALGIVVVVRRVKGGWELPFYHALSNGNSVSFEPHEDFALEDSISCDDPEFSDCGDGSSGLSSNCGETLMEGYELFNRN